jgi:hypothetical protein
MDPALCAVRAWLSSDVATATATATAPQPSQQPGLCHSATGCGQQPAGLCQQPPAASHTGTAHSTAQHSTAQLCRRRLAAMVAAVAAPPGPPSMLHTYLCICCAVAAALIVEGAAHSSSALLQAGGSVTINRGPGEVRTSPLLYALLINPSMTAMSSRRRAAVVCLPSVC